ncbi:YchJ family protein [Psychrobium sp. 1_MG-2023]|uniref:YchJ family protein n=1 Tax=Psychrobium sp. 1_MG-2023 TaxID=3062624 RepID=UPI00273423B9|nr:YchJ family protein [Psychrobium sp. 1_MG-2023]
MKTTPLMSNCPCGSELTYQQCCSPLHQGTLTATNAHQLMKSRYCAFVVADIDYLVITHSPQTRHNISHQSIKQWNSQCHWLGLDVRSFTEQGPNVQVEFIAWYKQDGEIHYHHEHSTFSQQPIDSLLAERLTEKESLPTHAWYYVDATYPEQKIPMPKRNDICICGSNKKFKKCCGS